MRRWRKQIEAKADNIPFPKVLNKCNRVDFFANRMNYVDHLLPIYLAMPEEYRGYFVVDGSTAGNWLTSDIEMIDYCKLLGFTALHVGIYRLQNRNKSNYLVVAGMSDIGTWKKKRLILTQHGCGGSWSTHHPSFAGGSGYRHDFLMILEPGEIPANLDKKSCPKTRVEIVGCPKMDKWYPVQPKAMGNPPVVAIGFHHDLRICPESRTALPHYMSAFTQLAEWQKTGEVKIIGAGHPSYWRTLLPIWELFDFEPVLDFDEVIKRANVYVRDQYSTIYEFASLDRPVVLLNAPWYRRNVEHGIRFWELSNVGINVNEPDELIPAIKLALTDPEDIKQARHGAVNKVYKYMDGKSTERAVSAILSLIKG